MLGAATYLVVDALPSQAATSGLRTATVSTGSVTQTISLSGSVERVDQVNATFRTSGTVTSVKVAIGDEVEAGDVLATIGTAPLKRAVTVAQADLVAAQAALDAAESSTSSTAASSPSSSSPSVSAPTPTASPSPSSSSSPGPRPTPVPSVDTGPVHRAVKVHDALVQAAVTTCQPVIDAGTTPTPTPTPTNTPSPSASPSPSANPSQTPSTKPSDDTPSPEPSASGAVATGSLHATNATLATDHSTEPTPEQVSSCVQALSAALTSAQHTASEMDKLTKALDAAAKALQQQQSTAATQGSTGQAGSFAATGSAAPSGSGGTVTAAGAGGGSQSTASLAVQVLKATQTLAGAEQDLDAAVLKAPISGTVGEVDLVKGSTASTSSGVVIVGPGSAVVTVDLPLAQLGRVRVDQDVTVTPAGTTTEVPGVVASIGVLPSSTTSSTPTYPVRITVSDAPVSLAAGSTATATITLATATDVLTVPVSAVTGVSAGTGSVQVVSGGTVKAATVTVGAVGQGKVQVDEGLTAGQVVVLADPSAALPSSDSTNRFRRTTSGVGGLSGQGGPDGGFGGGPRG